MAKKSLREQIDDLLNNDIPKSFDPDDQEFSSTRATRENFEHDFDDEFDQSLNKASLTFKGGLDNSLKEGKYAGRVREKEESEESEESDSFDYQNVSESESDSEINEGNSEDDALNEMDELEKELKDMETEQMAIIKPQEPENDLEKAQHVKNQKYLWDFFLDSRIKMQGLLTTANKLPQHDTHQTFTNFEPKIKKAFEETQKEIELLFTDLQDISTTFGNNNEEYPNFENEKIENQRKKISKKKRKISEISHSDLWQSLEDQYLNFEPYQNEVIQKWNSRTQLSTPHKQKQFKAINQTVLAQISNILKDNERLIQRTRLKRSNLVPFGEIENNKENTEKDVDSQIFDDTDFYQELLKQLLQSSGNATDSWKYQSASRKKKKKNSGYSKQSKGKRLRYEVHEKLQNFMAPNDISFKQQWSDSTELFSSLFSN